MTSVHRRAAAAFGAIGLVLLLLSVLILWIPTDTIAAQPGATVRARATNAAATAGAQLGGAAATVQARSTGIAGTALVQSTGIAATARARATALMATADGLGGEVRATAEAYATNAVATLQYWSTYAPATAQYLATTVHQDFAAVVGTATAINMNIETYLQSVPEDMAALIDALADSASLSYDPNSNSLIASATVTEADANAMMDVLLAASGYDPTTANLDMLPAGMIISLVDVNTGEALVMQYEFTVADCAIYATLVSATVNGIAVPLSGLPPEIQELVDLTVTGVPLQPIIYATGAPITYCAEELVLTDTYLLITYSIPVIQ